MIGEHEYKTVAWNAPRTLTASVTAKLVNLSVRAVVPSNGSVTFGFVIGIDNCTVLVRASGPALGGFGVPNTLANPRLAVYKGNSVINSNDDWCIPATNSGDVLSAGNKAGAFPLLLNSKDAAILLTLQPGAYTVQVMGEPNTTGEVLIEVYDINS